MTSIDEYRDWLKGLITNNKYRLDEINEKIRDYQQTKREIVGAINAYEDGLKEFDKLMKEK